jgi:hypothetical protein
LAIAAAVVMPTFASAETVDQLMADRVLRNAELEPRKRRGMASVDDPRCRTARQAENKRLFGTGATGTPSAPVEVFPSYPSINPQPAKHKTPSKSDPMPHG